jgi:hypothetical protein
MEAVSLIYDQSLQHNRQAKKNAVKLSAPRIEQPTFRSTIQLVKKLGQADSLLFDNIYKYDDSFL